MENQILQSIIQFTSERDADSLELSLTGALADLLPLSSITIMKSPEESMLDGFEEVLSTTITKTENGNSLRFNNDPRSILSDADLDSCLGSAKPVLSKSDSGDHRLLVPVVCEGKVVNVIVLHSKIDLAEHVSMLGGIVLVYSNYLAVLKESEKDSLTGLLNRKTFESKLNRLLQLQQLKKAEYSAPNRKYERREATSDDSAWLAMVDIDYFKRINDKYGHLYGDEVILMLSQKMKTSFRNSDLLFRYGGEEFLILLEPTSAVSAEMVLNRFRKTIEEHLFPQIGGVTVSLGFARISDADYPPTIVGHVDQALYYAKEHGRNCVCNYESLVRDGSLVEPESGPIDLF